MSMVPREEAYMTWKPCPYRLNYKYKDNLHYGEVTKAAENGCNRDLTIPRAWTRRFHDQFPHRGSYSCGEGGIQVNSGRKPSRAC